MYKGIDVSEHQGTINWKKVKAAGCRFAILRAMKQNGKADIQFLANARGCQENGIPYEVYRYTYALLQTRLQLSPHEQQVLKKVLHTSFLRMVKEPMLALKKAKGQDQQLYARLLETMLKGD